MTSAYEEYKGKKCLRYQAAAELGITIDLWQKWCKQARTYGYTTRPGGNGRESLIEFKAVPDKYRADIEAVYGKSEKVEHPLKEYFVMDAVARKFYEDFIYDDQVKLKEEQKAQYTLNSSVLKAAMGLLKKRSSDWARSGKSPRGAIVTVLQDIITFNEFLKGHETGLTHSLPENHRKLRDKLNQFSRSADPYRLLIDGRARNMNAAKIKAPDQASLLEDLVGKHTNFDNAQIAMLYNVVAGKLGWKCITPATVANHRSDLYTYSQRRGQSKFRDRKAMLVKRSAPTQPLYYWTLDGWQAELVYQKDGVNDKGQKVTTYHHRLTIVVVLDPCQKIKYPIGYAIGERETPQLIAQALRNAVNHTKELFGARYMPHQLQSDRYGNGTLTPLYEALTQLYTPARAHNAKAKVIEPYFNYLNKRYCQLFDNWSGVGITSNPESQPNTDYLNKIKKNFPDQDAVVKQLETIIGWERNKKREEYLQAWNLMPDHDKLALSNELYLKNFGEDTGFTYKLQHYGIAPTINGEQVYFDSFDIRLRECAHFDWVVKYDPEDLSQAIAINVKRKRNEIEMIGSHIIPLERQHVQPMAIRDRKEGDMEALQRVNSFNKNIEQKVIERVAKRREIVEQLLEHPALNDTLTKHVLTNSLGQHKDEMNNELQPKPSRALPAANPQAIAPTIEEPYTIVDETDKTVMSFI